MSFSNIIVWICRIVAAGLMLQTLYFKFSGAEESIYIFTKVGIEPWGRYVTGAAELVAAIVILIPAISGFGAVIAVGVMSGALLSHATILGIEVKGDGGQLFFYALAVFFCSLYVIWHHRQVFIQIFNTFLKNVQNKS